MKKSTYIYSALLLSFLVFPPIFAKRGFHPTLLISENGKKRESPKGPPLFPLPSNKKIVIDPKKEPSLTLPEPKTTAIRDLKSFSLFLTTPKTRLFLSLYETPFSFIKAPPIQVKRIKNALPFSSTIAITPQIIEAKKNEKLESRRTRFTSKEESFTPALVGSKEWARDALGAFEKYQEWLFTQNLFLKFPSNPLDTFLAELIEMNSACLIEALEEEFEESDFAFEFNPRPMELESSPISLQTTFSYRAVSSLHRVYPDTNIESLFTIATMHAPVSSAFQESYPDYSVGSRSWSFDILGAFEKESDSLFTCRLLREDIAYHESYGLLMNILKYGLVSTHPDRNVHPSFASFNLPLDEPPLLIGEKNPIIDIVDLPEEDVDFAFCYSFLTEERPLSLELFERKELIAQSEFHEWVEFSLRAPSCSLVLFPSISYKNTPINFPAPLNATLLTSILETKKTGVSTLISHSPIFLSLTPPYPPFISPKSPKRSPLFLANEAAQLTLKTSLHLTFQDKTRVYSPLSFQENPRIHAPLYSIPEVDLREKREFIECPNNEALFSRLLLSHSCKTFASFLTSVQADNFFALLPKIAENNFHCIDFPSLTPSLALNAYPIAFHPQFFALQKIDSSLYLKTLLPFSNLSFNTPLKEAVFPYAEALYELDIATIAQIPDIALPMASYLFNSTFISEPHYDLSCYTEGSPLALFKQIVLSTFDYHSPKTHNFSPSPFSFLGANSEKIFSLSLHEAEETNRYQRLVESHLTEMPSLNDLDTDCLSDDFKTNVRIYPLKDKKGYIFAAHFSLFDKDLIEPFPHHVYYILDLGSSMESHRFDTYKQGILQSLGYLTKTTAFNVFLLSGEATPLFSEELLPNKNSALLVKKAFQNLKQGRNPSFLTLSKLLTKIKEKAAKTNEIYSVILLSDGQFFKSIRFHQEHFKSLLKVDAANLSIYTVPVSDNNNLPMLGALAKLNRGELLHCGTHAALPRKLSVLTRKIQSPIVAYMKATLVEQAARATLADAPDLLPTLFSDRGFTLYGQVPDLQDLDLFLQGKGVARWVNIRKRLQLSKASRGEASLEREYQRRLAFGDLLDFIFTSNPNSLTTAQTSLSL